MLKYKVSLPDVTHVIKINIILIPFLCPREGGGREMGMRLALMHMYWAPMNILCMHMLFSSTAELTMHTKTPYTCT